MKDVLKEQVGGTHYMNQEYQVIQFLQDVQLNSALGFAVKYLSRYPNKDSYDLAKATHCIELFKHWFNTSGLENGISNYQPITLDLDKVIKFTHQFEPSKAKLLQEIINLNSYGNLLQVKLEDFNSRIDYTIQSIHAYQDGVYEWKSH